MKLYCSYPGAEALDTTLALAEMMGNSKETVFVSGRRITGNVQREKLAELLRDEDTRTICFSAENTEEAACMIIGSLAMLTTDTPDGRSVPTGRIALIVDYWIMQREAAESISGETGSRFEFAVKDALVYWCRQNKIGTIFGYRYSEECTKEYTEHIFVDTGFKKIADTKEYSAWKYDIPSTYTHLSRGYERIDL